MFPYVKSELVGRSTVHCDNLRTTKVLLTKFDRLVLFAFACMLARSSVVYDGARCSIARECIFPPEIVFYGRNSRIFHKIHSRAIEQRAPSYTTEERASMHAKANKTKRSNLVNRTLVVRRLSVNSGMKL